uniref:Ig-like domain-containing protein n=1 Tax=Esox lucius TaxID=8010 RepID=A0A6Q2XUA9_ESOLU
IKQECKNISLSKIQHLVSVLKRVSGDTRSLFTRVGDNVSLSCTNVVYQDCSSTTWNYHRTGLQSVIEEVGHGKIQTNSKRADRLKVGSDCSLHVSDVRAEDAGIYTCQQFLKVGGPQYESHAPVHLSVLNSEPVTLRCFLYTSDGPGICSSGVTEHVSLLWVDQAGNNLTKDSRHQVIQTSNCDITLTVTLQKEDNNRKWTCQLIIDGKKNISLDFNLTLFVMYLKYIVVLLLYAMSARCRGRRGSRGRSRHT